MRADCLSYHLLAENCSYVYNTLHGLFVSSQDALSKTVADPGFSKLERQPIIWPIFPKTA